MSSTSNVFIALANNMVILLFRVNRHRHKSALLPITFLRTASKEACYFLGDYAPTSTSLIGALRRKFSLNVGQLAADKEEDLRRLFHCWWSKPLPDELELPFR